MGLCQWPPVVCTLAVPLPKASTRAHVLCRPKKGWQSSYSEDDQRLVEICCIRKLEEPEAVFVSTSVSVFFVFISATRSHERCLAHVGRLHSRDAHTSASRSDLCGANLQDPESCCNMFALLLSSQHIIHLWLGGSGAGVWPK